MQHHSSLLIILYLIDKINRLFMNIENSVFSRTKSTRGIVHRSSDLNNTLCVFSFDAHISITKKAPVWMVIIPTTPQRPSFFTWFQSQPVHPDTPISSLSAHTFLCPKPPASFRYGPSGLLPTSADSCTRWMPNALCISIFYISRSFSSLWLCSYAWPRWREWLMSRERR